MNPERKPPTNAEIESINLFYQTWTEKLDAVRRAAQKLFGDNRDWAQVVLDVLVAFDERKASLPDWWLYSRMVNAFGSRQPGQLTPETWLAMDRFDELMRCCLALTLYHQMPWYRRILNRRRFETAQRELDSMIEMLSEFDQAWIDRSSFQRFLKSRNG